MRGDDCVEAVQVDERQRSEIKDDDRGPCRLGKR
jgi:hypothetical protein